MKKRTLSLILALVMVLSMVLSISPVRVLTVAAPTDTATIIVRDENGSAVDHASVVVKRNGVSLAVDKIDEGLYQFKKGDVSQSATYEITVEKIGYESQTVTMHGTSGSILITLVAVTGRQWQTFQVRDASGATLAEVSVDLISLKEKTASVKYQEGVNNNLWEFVPAGTEAAFWTAVESCMDSGSVNALVEAGLGSGFKITSLKKQMDGTGVAEGSTDALISVYDENGIFLGAGSGNAGSLYAKYLNQEIDWNGLNGTYIDNGKVYNIVIAETSADTYKIFSRVEDTSKVVVTYTDGVDEEEIFPDTHFAVTPGTQTLPVFNAPEWEGYTLEKWALQSGEEHTGAITENITLYAVWIIAPKYVATVKVYKEAIFSDTTGEVLTGDACNITDILGSGTLCLLSEDGTNFVPMTANGTGIYTASVANGEYYIYYDNGKTYERLGNQILWMENASRTCYLIYNNTITYNYNGGSQSTVTSYVLSGSEVSVRDEVPVREGHTFAGWLDIDTGFVYQSGAQLTASVDKDYTLVAQWIDNNAQQEFRFTITRGNLERGPRRKLAAVDVAIIRISGTDRVELSTQNITFDSDVVSKSVPVTPGYYYSVQILRYYLSDGSTLEAYNNQYCAKVTAGDPNGTGVYIDATEEQQDNVIADIVVAPSQRGVVLYLSEEDEEPYLELDVIMMPDLSNPEYIPVSSEGKKFLGWECTYGFLPGVGELLTGVLEFTAVWDDDSVPETPPETPPASSNPEPDKRITVSGRITVDNAYWQINEDNSIGHQNINDVDRVRSVTVLLQREVAGTGYCETVDVQTVFIGAEHENTRRCDCGTAGCTKEISISVVEFLFPDVPEENYRIVVLSPNYSAVYQNEAQSDLAPNAYGDYSELNYWAVDRIIDNIYKVNALMKFAPPSFELEYAVDASQIGSALRPTEVEVLVTYDTPAIETDSSRWDVISQMKNGNDLQGDFIGMTDGKGASSYPVWSSSTDGKSLYDYGIRVHSVDGQEFMIDDPRFAILYQAPAHLDTLAGGSAQTQMLIAVLVPRTYSIRYELDGGTLVGQEVPTSYTWSHGESFAAIPTRSGYVFEGWDVQIGDGERYAWNGGSNVISADTTGDITFYAKWSRVVVNLQVVIDQTGASVFEDLLNTQLTFRPAGSYEENFRPVEDAAYTNSYEASIWHTDNAVDVVEIPYIHTGLSKDNDYNINITIDNYYIIESYTFDNGVGTAQTGVTVDHDATDEDNTTEAAHNVVVCLKYDSDMLNLRFDVEVPLPSEEAERMPVSVGVKVTYWNAVNGKWTVIDQHKETVMEVPIDAAGGVGEGVCSVSRWQNATMPYYYRIEVVSLNLQNGNTVNLTEKNVETYTAVGYRATVSVTDNVAGAPEGVCGKADGTQAGTLKAVVNMGKVVFHANNMDAEDVFRTYYPAEEEGLLDGDGKNFVLLEDGGMESFYDIPAFEYKTHNKYIFKGWYTDPAADTPMNWASKYLTEDAANIHLYAQWIETGTVEKEATDTKNTGKNTYSGFDLFGVQIRNAEDDNIPHHGDAGSGIRFLASMSEAVFGELEKLQADFEYGFVLAPSVNVSAAAGDDNTYELLYMSDNVNGVDTTQTHAYVTNQQCNGVNGEGEKVEDHYNGEAYRIFTVVITYKNLQGTALATAQETDFTVRAYVRYTDANNLVRTYHNNYTGTVFHNGISISYADASKVITSQIQVTG